jgi:hypothetical protein
VLAVVSTPIAVAYTVDLFLFILGPGWINEAKGFDERYGWGFVQGWPLWLFTMWLLATPDSRWARRFYGPKKLARSCRRYGSAQDAA